jgi:hypothetical protein
MFASKSGFSIKSHQITETQGLERLGDNHMRIGRRF